MSDRFNIYKNRSKNDESARGKRREFAVSLRKDKRREKLDKRRDLDEIENEMREFMTTDPSGVKIASLCPIIQDDSNPAAQFDALTKLRKLLATNKELPIQATIDCGILPKLVQMLSWQHAPETQYEAAWVLTNVSSGTPDQTAAVVHEHAAGPLCRLLESSSEKVKDQACWCLGNIAGDGPDLRDMLLQNRALEIFLNMLVSEESLELLRNVSWTVSNFFRWKEKPVSIEYMSYSLQYLAERMDTQDPEIVSNVCWAVCYIAETTELLLDVILQNFGDQLMSFLRLPDHDAQLPAIRTLGSISAGSDEQTQGVLERGLLEVCPNLLLSRKATVRKDTCWTLSNVCAGSYDQISAVLSTPLIMSLIEKCESPVEQFKVKLDAAWSLCNVFSQGNDQHADYMVSIGAVSAILAVLTPNMEASGIVVFLDALEKALIRGAVRADHSAAPNEVTTNIEELGGIDLLNRLMEHQDDTVSKRAEEIAEQYFGDVVADPGLAPNVNAAGTAFAFGMQNPPPGAGGYAL